MNEILFGLVLFCFIIFMIETEKDNKNDLIIKNKINEFSIINKNGNDKGNDKGNINNNTYSNSNIEEQITLTYSNTPTFRGFVDLYYPPDIKEEGGSKPFNDQIIDDDNLTVNQVNYDNYESYRKKPFTLKK